MNPSELSWETACNVFGQWLEYYGPMSTDDIHEKLFIERSIIDHLLDDLLEAERVISGNLVADLDVLICERENYEILLRMNRKENIPEIEPLPITWLQYFLADIQGLAKKRNDIYACLDQLFGFPLDVQLLESDFLPSRLKSYTISMLDRIMQEGVLCWIGRDKKIVLAHQAEMDLVGEFREKGNREGVLPSSEGKYDFNTLVRTSGLRVTELTDALWEGVWAGHITNDTFEVVRKGAAGGYKSPKIDRPLRSRRRSFRSWEAVTPFAGNWFVVNKPVPPQDLLVMDGLLKERVRILFARYGILFRELLRNELPAFKWAEIFKTLRLLELAGEIYTGYFFEGISGPQFISSAALRKLQQGFESDSDHIFWVNAQDPASLCGITVEGLSLPPRVRSTHIIYSGADIILISKRLAKLLEFRVLPGSPEVHASMEFFQHFLLRETNPLIKIIIETVNGIDAIKSEYIEAFDSFFEIRKNDKQVHLFKKRY